MLLRRILCFFWVSLCNCFFFTVRSVWRVHADDASPKENEKSCTFYGPDDKQNQQQLHNSMSDHVWESRIELLFEAVSSKCRLSFSTDDISRFVQELCRVMTVSFIVEKVFLGFSSSTISTLRNVNSDEELAEIDEEEEAFDTEEEKDELFHDAGEDSSILDDFDLNSVLQVGSFYGEVVSGDADENKLGLLSEAVIYEEQACDDDDGGDLEESIWEHEDIIEQLKFELKLTRTGGLPTIIEEEEEEEEELESISSPGIALAGDPKPMNCTIQAEQKVEQMLEQIQKVHRMYGEKMRELDALNYRTMHAIGIAQMKEHPNSTKKSGNILLLPRLIRRRKKKVWPEVVISMESMIYDDLELVSVGQMCLSWEILHWQYRKARQLLQIHHSTTHNHPQYYYAKKPCIVGGILQVPAITSDNDCLIGKEREKGASINIIELVAIIEESIHDLWCFIRSDKVAADIINNQNKKTPSSIQQQGSAADSTLFMAVRTHLLKKKRRLKDIVRSSNCIVKKKKKEQQQIHLIIAQIQLKLISRVLRMRKLTTYRLLWCRHKLDQTPIDVTTNNIYHVEDEEPSFFLFPC